MIDDDLFLCLHPPEYLDPNPSKGDLDNHLNRLRLVNSIIHGSNTIDDFCDRMLSDDMNPDDWINNSLDNLELWLNL